MARKKSHAMKGALDKPESSQKKGGVSQRGKKRDHGGDDATQPPLKRSRTKYQKRKRGGN
uniref:Uncharacterized protein n=1 Tax=Oryza meridionalis TaxID=40149 RepID=A0A0E0F4Z7_9ORYZ